MYPTYRLFKHTCFTFLRSLQDISQSHIKCTENASLTHDNNDNDDSSDIIVVVINDDNDSNFKNKEKVQL